MDIRLGVVVLIFVGFGFGTVVNGFGVVVNGFGVVVNGFGVVNGFRVVVLTVVGFTFWVGLVVAMVVNF